MDSKLIISFSDLNHNIKPDLVYDLDSIKQHIITILTTRKKTLLFRSDFGCDLEDYLFDLMSPETEFAIKNEVIRAIDRWEPRVELDLKNTNISSDPKNHIVWLSLAYVIKSNGNYTIQEIGLKR